MIIKIVKNGKDKSKPKRNRSEHPRGFAGLLHYLERKGSELIHTENIVGGNAAEMTKYFNEVSSRSSRIKDPVFHAVISFAYNEVTPSDETISAMARQYLQKLGYGNQPWAMYRHDDKKHIHFHVVSSRVDIRTGRGINNSFECRRTWAILKDLAPLFGYGVGREKADQEVARVFESDQEERAQGQISERAHEFDETSSQDFSDVSPDYASTIMDDSRNEGLVNQLNRIVQEVVVNDQPYSMYRFIQGCKDRGLKVKKLPRGYVVQQGTEHPVGLSKLPIFATRRLSHILRENKQFRNREKGYIAKTLLRVLRSLPPLDMQYESAPDLFAYKLQQLMSEYGVNVIYNTNSSGVAGVSFEHSGITLKGSDIKQSWETIIESVRKRSSSPVGGKTTTHKQKTGNRVGTLIAGAAVGRRMSEDEEEKRIEAEQYQK